ncbi:hypothetical protein [Nostoc sp.]|uniref:hypothetical protein n=1 Tax=Nostoc sp. TaxID=1180 RepID=UPI002FFA90E2
MTGKKVGCSPLDAFTKYKKEHWLEHPDTLGSTTASSLLEILEKHQGSTDQPQLSSGSQSSKTGPSMKLPSGKIVYSDERIIDTIPSRYQAEMFVIFGNMV